MMTDAEIEATRFHLGYGNLDFGAYPYTSDGFKQIFRDVVAPNLTTGAETSSSTAITAAGVVIVTPVSMTGIAAQVRLVIDVADASEIVAVRSTTSTTFSAAFTKAHPAGYPVCVESGTTRLRSLLWRAGQAWEKMTDVAVAGAAGIKKVDEIEFFQGFQVSKDKLSHYKQVARQIASLTRVPPAWECGPAPFEVY